MCGRWLGKHGVNVQKGASFLLASFSNPDSFFWKVFHPLPLKKKQKNKFQPGFFVQFLPIDIIFNSPLLFLPFITGVSPLVPLALTLSWLPVLVSFSSSLTPETDRLITAYVEAKVRVSQMPDGL